MYIYNANGDFIKNVLKEHYSMEQVQNLDEQKALTDFYKEYIFFADMEQTEEFLKKLVQKCNVSEDIANSISNYLNSLSEDFGLTGGRQDTMFYPHEQKHKYINEINLFNTLNLPENDIQCILSFLIEYANELNTVINPIDDDNLINVDSESINEESEVTAESINEESYEPNENIITSTVTNETISIDEESKVEAESGSGLTVNILYILIFLVVLYFFYTNN